MVERIAVPAFDSKKQNLRLLLSGEETQVVVQAVCSRVGVSFPDRHGSDEGRGEIGADARGEHDPGSGRMWLRPGVICQPCHLWE